MGGRRTGSTRHQQLTSLTSDWQLLASSGVENEFVGAAIGAMASSEDLSTQIPKNAEISQKLMGELVPIIYKALQVKA